MYFWFYEHARRAFIAPALRGEPDHNRDPQRDPHLTLGPLLLLLLPSMTGPCVLLGLDGRNEGRGRSESFSPSISRDADDR